MAPLLGVTDNVYRTAFARHLGGFDLALAPFVKTVQHGCYPQARLADLLPQNNSALPVYPQILSNNPADFLLLAQKLFDLGHDLVNLNLGCPMPTSTAKTRGAGLLPYPDKVDHFLASVMALLPGGLSLKIRTGLHDPHDLDRLIPIFNRYPLREIIIHPRTAAQKYAGAIDLVSFERLLADVRHNVVYNGEINTLAGYCALRDRYPQVTRWMLGRGAIRDPFLPAAIKNQAPASAAQRLFILRSFHDEILQNTVDKLHADRAVILRMLTLWNYWATSFAPAERLFKKLGKVGRLLQYSALVDEIFARR